MYFHERFMLIKISVITAPDTLRVTTYCRRDSEMFYTSHHYSYSSSSSSRRQRALLVIYARIIHQTTTTNEPSQISLESRHSVVTTSITSIDCRCVLSTSRHVLPSIINGAFDELRATPPSQQHLPLSTLTWTDHSPMSCRCITIEHVQLNGAL